MKTNDSELYVLLDGTYAAASDCAKGDDGVMRGASGVPVAMTDDGEPMTVKRQADLGGAASAAAMGKADDGEPMAATEASEATEEKAAVQPPVAPRPAASAPVVPAPAAPVPAAADPAPPAPAPVFTPAASESRSDDKSDSSKIT